MLKFKKMGTEKIPLLLVTANVGSLFESPIEMLPLWTKEFLLTVSKTEPKFIGVHMQEVGGKTYEKSMDYVQRFVQILCDSTELKLFDKVRIYLDEDYTSAEKFTALGNVYFIHSTISDVKIWDFLNEEWLLVEGKEINTGNIEKVSTKEKAKFPQHFFPECKWSRKGFMRVRWMLRGTAFELINIHLFHDASNILAAEASPSVYCRSRRRAFHHTLQHLHQDPREPPFFIFGDFNFRLDTAGVIKKLGENLKVHRIHSTKSTELTKLQYRDSKDEKVIMTLGKKEFSHVDHQKVFREQWVLKYDKELDLLKPYLYEFPIKFVPTYPFEENIDQPTNFMKTRCPAWCDRILLSQTARMIINHSDGQKFAFKDSTESRRSIVEQIDGVLKHGSRRSITETTDSGGGSPSKGSQRSSHSSSESSPARSASPNKYGSPIKKPISSDFDGLHIPGIAQSRKSIADPTNIVHAINTKANDIEGSPVKKRLVRNQSEGSPKLGEHIDLRKISADTNNPSLRKRVEYGVIGENVCMGDHKPVYLRILLQSDKGTVRCCMQKDPDKYCYMSPIEVPSETCFRHPSASNLSKCPSKECFEPFAITSYISRLASQINQDLRTKSFSYKENHLSFCKHETDSSFSKKLKDSCLVHDNESSEKFSIKNSFSDSKALKDDLNFSDDNLQDNVIPNVQINITDADYVSYDGIIVNNVDTHLLYCATAPIFPYTPESIESRSPYPEASNDATDSEKLSYLNIPINQNNVNVFDRDFDNKINSSLLNDDFKFHIEKSNSLDKCSYLVNKAKSVSPRQLKSRLESILQTSKLDMDISDDSVDLDVLANDELKLECVNNVEPLATVKHNRASDKIKIKAKSKCKCFGCNVC